MIIPPFSLIFPHQPLFFPTYSMSVWIRKNKIDFLEKKLKEKDMVNKMPSTAKLCKEMKRKVKKN